MDETLINTANTTVSSNTDQIKYSPNINFVGKDTLLFKVNDGTNDSQNALFIVTVNNVNDYPVAIRDTISILEDNAAIITLNGTDIFSRSGGFRNVDTELNPNFDTYGPEFTEGISEVQDFWVYHYKAINRANTLLSRAESIENYKKNNTNIKILHFTKRR